MARLKQIQTFSGRAAGFEAVESNPLELVSRDLYLDENGNMLDGLERWKLPERKIGDVKKKDFQRHWTANPLVVIGGFEFLVELGVIATWLVNDATRADARKLIEKRDWDKFLEPLGVKGKEPNAQDLIGKGSINDFLKHSPDVRRESHLRSRASFNQRERADHVFNSRMKHCLRLRKAIEFITLVEAALAIRYKGNRTMNRTRNYTGIDKADVSPEIVWDVLWLEPANYTMSHLPGPENYSYVLDNQAVVQNFVEQSGQVAETLHWIMDGVPGKFRTVKAAVDACNKALGNAPAVVTSIKPGDYRKRMKLLDPKVSRVRKNGVEMIVEPGPLLAFDPK